MMFSLPKLLLRSFNPVLKRFIFSASYYHIDRHELGMKQKAEKLQYPLERFWKRMERYLNPKNNMYMTGEELLMSIYLANTPEQVETLLRLSDHYWNQCHKYGLFTMSWGIPLLRTLTVLRQPDAALSCVTDRYNVVFGSSFCFAMAGDILLESDRPKDVLTIWEKWKNSFEDRQSKKLAENDATEDAKSPFPIQILVCAACYNLGTQQYFDYASEFIDLSTQGHGFIQRRAVAFLVALALKLNHADQAHTLMLIMRKSSSCCLGRSLNVIVAAKQSKLSDALLVLNSLLDTDAPTADFDRLISSQAISELTQVMEHDRTIEPELRRRCEEAIGQIERDKCLTTLTIDELLKQPIGLEDIDATYKDIHVSPLESGDELEPIDDEDNDNDVAKMQKRQAPQEYRDRIVQEMVEKIKKEGPFGSAQ